MSIEKKMFDMIIIGSGQGGTPLAQASARAGNKTALVERKYIGGSCINVGCTPTKTMIASARVAHLVSRAKDYGIETAKWSVDFLKVRERKQDLVESFRNGSRKRLLSTDGLTLLEGEASFTGIKELKVDYTGGGYDLIKADTIVINTGAAPARLHIPGMDSIKALDSTSIMEIDDLPEHLIIIGGGYVGLEFGQMFRRFGSKVTILHRGDQLLSREDRDIAEEVYKILKNDGIEIILQSKPEKVAASGNNHIALTIVKDDQEKLIRGSHLLVATGRNPNTAALNLELTGLKINERGFIAVNDNLETAVSGIYAIGDVNGGPAFTHISYDDYRILSKNLLQDGNAVTTGRQVPYVVFIDPQLGRIGLTEKEAEKHGYNYRVAKMPMSWVARALETDETAGMMKAIVDVNTDQILGAAILGLEGGEIMAILQMAMLGNVPYTTIRDTIFAHPTLSESLNNLFSSFDN
ncbi:MAG: mercuric reductase [Bacillota bacterium]|nr:mercuric reductase [Bacillota bacterium]